MSKFQAGKYLKVFVFLLLCAVCTDVSDAQKTRRRKDRLVKKTAAPVTPVKTDAAPVETIKPVSADVPVAKTGRLPIIIIPGLIGSELINKATGEKVWFSLGRSKNDDMRLPISPDIKANKDNLVAGDILRRIQLIRLTPEVDIYKKLIDSLEADGFTEGNINAPPDNGYADTFYVFAYDWRLDNVENAQNLLRKMDVIRQRVKRPNLKFNVVAHSMGGLLARYAAMYGNADLPAGLPHPVWKGANYFNSLSLVATPNAGALGALDSLLNGFSLFGNGKINLPFVQNLSRFDLFTIPSIYQLLPHRGFARAFDENLKPLKIDVYDPLVWEKYNWTAYTQDEFPKKVDNATTEQAKAYFRAVLLRAKRFQIALDAAPLRRSPIPTYYLGAGCKPTVDGMIIHKNAKKGFWETDFGAADYVKSDGTKVTSKQTENFLVSLGDGVVPKRSLLFSYVKDGKFRNTKTTAVINDLTDSCAEHNRLTGDEKVEKVLLSIFNNQPVISAPVTIDSIK